MSVSFNAISLDILTPGSYVEFDASNATQGLTLQPHDVLAIGCKLAAGSAASNIPKRVTSDAEADALFGVGSQAAEMCRAARKQNSGVSLWCIGQPEAAGSVKAVGAFTYAGTATEAGTLVHYIAGHRIPVAVTSGMTAAALETAAVAAIQAHKDYARMPVTVAADAGVGVDAAAVTCKWGGSSGNGIDLRVSYFEGEKVPAGITVTITAMASGATDPATADAIANFGDRQWNTILLGSSEAANLTAIEAELLERFGPMVQQEGHCFIAKKDTLSALTTFGDGRNSMLVTCIGMPSMPTPPWIVAAAAGMESAFQSTIDPARPLQTLVLKGVLPPAESARFIREERDTLLRDGISTFTVSASGVVAIERLITMYQENAAGLADRSYLDLTTLRTLAFLRYSLRAHFANKYPRHKLADDGTQFDPGQAVITPSIARGEVLYLFGQWERAGLVEGAEQFASQLIVQRSATDPNRMDMVIPPDLINGFSVLAARMGFLV